MIYLGIDHGERRIGLAKSDPLGMFAHGIGYVENTDDAKVFEGIKKVCDEFQVDALIVGLPKTLEGELGIAAEKVLAFVKQLEEALGLPVKTWDERLTTKSAHQFMKGAKMRGKKKKQKVDQLAAQIMLQGFLDSQPSVER